jgi:hypothetical protein
MIFSAESGTSRPHGGERRRAHRDEREGALAGALPAQLPLEPDDEPEERGQRDPQEDGELKRHAHVSLA